LIRSLRRSTDFDRVMRVGRRRRAGDLVVFSAPGVEGEVRVGLVVGRRVGSAVDRNRVKRRLRHALRGVEIEDGTDLVVIASPGARTAGFATLVSWLQHGSKERA
jgi:ribonuclease P protein component